MANMTQASGRSRSGSDQTNIMVGTAAQISAVIATNKAYCARLGSRRINIHIASDITPNKKHNRSESLGFFHLLPFQTLRIVIKVGFAKPKTAGQALASAPELR